MQNIDYMYNEYNLLRADLIVMNIARINHRS